MCERADGDSVDPGPRHVADPLQHDAAGGLQQQAGSPGVAKLDGFAEPVRREVVQQDDVDDAVGAVEQFLELPDVVDLHLAEAEIVTGPGGV